MTAFAFRPIAFLAALAAASPAMAEGASHQKSSNWIRMAQPHATEALPKLGAPNAKPGNAGADALGDMPGAPPADKPALPRTHISDITLKRGVVGAKPLLKLQQTAINGNAPAKPSIPPQYKALTGGLQ